MIWKTCQIQPHLDDIQKLLDKTHDHKHAENYLNYPLFEHTVFARMGWAPHLVYYSAGIERPEYDGSIRIMSRHTRASQYDFKGFKADLVRGLATLDNLTNMALDYGYEDIWVSREESPKLLEYFALNSIFDWNVSFETLPIGGNQYVLRKT